MKVGSLSSIYTQLLYLVSHVKIKRSISREECSSLAIFLQNFISCAFHPRINQKTNSTKVGYKCLNKSHFSRENMYWLNYNVTKITTYCYDLGVTCHFVGSLSVSLGLLGTWLLVQLEMLS